MRIPSKHSGFVNGMQTCWGGGGGQSSTTVTAIPTELKPLASAYATKAMDLSNQGYQSYDGQRYADLNGMQTSGADAMYNRAINGSSTVNAGEQNVADTLSGNYLNSNPYLDASFKAQSGAVTDAYNTAAKGTDATMARSGAFGGSSWQQAQQQNSDTLAKNLGDLSTSVYANNYTNERANQMAAQNTALNYGNQDYTDASQAIKAGQMYQDQSQQNLDYGYEQYQDQQNLPYKQLAAMSGVFGTDLGKTQTTKSSGGGK